MLISYLRSLAGLDDQAGTEPGTGTGPTLPSEQSGSGTVMPGETAPPDTLILPGEEVGPGHQLAHGGALPAANLVSPGETIAQLFSPGEIASAISSWSSSDDVTLYGEPSGLIGNLVLPGDLPVPFQMTLPGETVAVYDMYAPAGAAAVPVAISLPGETLLDGDYSHWLDTEQYHAAGGGTSPPAEPEPAPVLHSPAWLVQLLDYFL